MFLEDRRGYPFVSTPDGNDVTADLLLPGNDVISSLDFG